MRRPASLRFRGSTLALEVFGEERVAGAEGGAELPQLTSEAGGALGDARQLRAGGGDLHPEPPPAT